jgi:aerobic C4-dicarboxylate transport protein
LALLGVAMLTSKGASGVTGAGFITLAATLAVVPSIPVAGLALILGIDRFMSEARSITNFIGNGVAAIVVARWENELDLARLTEELTGAHSSPSRPSSERLLPNEVAASEGRSTGEVKASAPRY